MKANSYMDCHEVCQWMTLARCKYFNYFTENFEGEMKGYCTFSKEYMDRFPMKNVVSASVILEMIIG